MGEQSNNNGENFASNWDWSERSIDEAIRILSDWYIDIASKANAVDDMRHATDVHLLVNDLRVGVRVRRQSYAARYGNEITFRSKVVNGGTTEWDKIRFGLGDLIFYAFADDDAKLVKWSIIDLHELRVLIPERSEKIKTIRNTDGTEFKVLDLRDFPEAVIHRGHT